MVSKIKKTVFICQECGYKSIRWLGKCPSCGKWNSFVEELETPKIAVGYRQNSSAISIQEVSTDNVSRISTGIGALDLVLGSGLVPSSVVLLGGDPGIGKSTLSLKFAQGIAQNGKKVLYISGEESIQQIKMRAERIGSLSKNIYLFSETNLELIMQVIKDTNPFLVILDSIQTVFLPEFSSSPGSVGQVRECASLLSSEAKNFGFSLWMIGHVTKEGSLAGPRVLEHLVDVVLYFEGDRYGNFRLLRAIKNRFGATNEIALFEMANSGLKEVLNPSQFFISHYNPQNAGVCIASVIEGVRPILVETQALVARASGFGAPLRRSQGFDQNRLSLLLAVLEKRLGYKFYEYDVFISLIGGIKIKDPGADLAVVLAIISSLKSIPVPRNSVAIGEVSLSGEVRAVSMMNQRIKEALRLGFTNVIAPKDSAMNLEDVLLIFQ